MSRSRESICKTLDSIRHEIVRVFQDAARFHWTHEQLLERRFGGLGIFKRPDYDTLPRWAMSQLEGVWWTMDHLMWRHQLVFTYKWEGKRYALGTPEYRAIPVREIDTDTGAYCWKDDITRFFTQPGSHVNDPDKDTENQRDTGTASV